MGGDFIDGNVFSGRSEPLIEINGSILSGVRRVKVTSEKSLKPDGEYGDFPRESREGGDSFSVYIERSLTDERDYFSLNDFWLTVTGKAAAFTYGGCRWLKIEESYDAENGCTQTMLLVSRARRAVKGAASNAEH